MTYDDTLMVMGVLRAAYPNYYKGMTRKEADGIVGLWTAMFVDEPVELVLAAVKAHVATDVKGYPPHIGAIKNAIVKLRVPEEMTELEAWSLVRSAISGASMDDTSRVFRDGVFSPPSAVVQFEQLPPVLQRLVGDPARLAAWNMVPSDELETVLQSNFMRSYRARAAHERELLALPADIRQTMQQIAAGSRLMLEGE